MSWSPLPALLGAAVVVAGVFVAGCSAGGGAAVLSGTVVDADGRPVAGATVAVVDAPVAVPDIAAISRDDGSFTLGLPAAGSYRVAAHGEQGSGQATVSVTEDTASVRLVLEP